MSEDKLIEKFGFLSMTLGALLEKAAQMQADYREGLEKSQSQEKKAFADHGDVRRDVGVHSERIRVYNLWERFHQYLSHRFGSDDSGIGDPDVLKESLAMGHSILGDVMYTPVELTGSETERPEDEKKESKPEPDLNLMTKIVKLMAKTGTRSGGMAAAWTIEEIKYGLQVVMPGISGNDVLNTIMKLIDLGVVFQAPTGMSWLVDDYADRIKDSLPSALEVKPEISKQEALCLDLKETLQSNRDARGKLTRWNLGALFYALRDKHPWVTKDDIINTLRKATWCRCEERLEKFVYIGDSVVPDVVSDAPVGVGVVKMADAVHELLLRGATGSGRIWKEYDIIGILDRADAFGVRVDKEHMTQENLSAALTFLVAEGRLEVVPVSPERPWIKEPGWRVR